MQAKRKSCERRVAPLNFLISLRHILTIYKFKKSNETFNFAIKFLLIINEVFIAILVFICKYNVINLIHNLSYAYDKLYIKFMTLCFFCSCCCFYFCIKCV